MSVIRINKTKDYTVMSNYHFRDKGLSLAAKGLLSLMLSLPEDWDYSVAGLTTLNRDGRDKIMTTLKELEDHKYLIRTRQRDEKGLLKGTIFDIFEFPQTEDFLKELKNTRFHPKSENPTLDKPTLDKPTLDNPTLDKPTLANPMLEKPTQYNTYLSNTKESNTYLNESKKALQDRNSKRKTFNEIIEEQIDSLELQDALKAYIQMRLANGFKLTNQTLEIMLKQLYDIAHDDISRIKVVNNATIGGYKRFFPLDNDSKKAKESFMENGYDFDALEKDLIAN